MKRRRFTFLSVTSSVDISLLASFRLDLNGAKAFGAL